MDIDIIIHDYAVQRMPANAGALNVHLVALGAVEVLFAGYAHKLGYMTQR
jgi:hypothetical protein